MSVLDSMPDRPLSRTEVDALGEHDKVHGIFPVYGERPELRDTAYGIVFAFDGAAHALAYTKDGWEVVEKREVDSDSHGVRFDDQETISELQSVAAAEAGAVDV